MDTKERIGLELQQRTLKYFGVTRETSVLIDSQKAAKVAQAAINEWGRGSDYDIVVGASLDAIKDQEVYGVALAALKDECAEDKDYIVYYSERKYIALSLRAARVLKGLTQTQLADMTGLKQQNIQRIESAAYSTGIDIIAKIAKALGKKIDIV